MEGSALSRRSPPLFYLKPLGFKIVEDRIGEVKQMNEENKMDRMREEIRREAQESGVPRHRSTRVRIVADCDMNKTLEEIELIRTAQRAVRKEELRHRSTRVRIVADRDYPDTNTKTLEERATARAHEYMQQRAIEKTRRASSKSNANITKSQHKAIRDARLKRRAARNLAR